MPTIVAAKHKLGAKGMSARLQQWADYRFLDAPSIWGGFVYRWSPDGLRVNARSVAPAEIRWTETEISVLPRKDAEKDLERAFWLKELQRIADGTLPSAVLRLYLPTEGRKRADVKAALSTWLRRVTAGKFYWGGGDGNAAPLWYQNPDGSEVYGILRVLPDKLQLEVRDPGPERRSAYTRQWMGKLQGALTAHAAANVAVGADDNGKSDKTGLFVAAGAAAIVGVGIAIAATSNGGSGNNDKHERKRRR